MVVNNPNNWHWVDKNCIDWSRKYFDDKLVGLKGESGSKTVQITSVSSVEGDVEVCQRKGKVISLFDLKLVLSISGESERPFTGSITIPELAYDTEEDEIQFDVSIYKEDSTNEDMRLVAKKELVPQIRSALSKFGTDLITSQSSDIQLDKDQVNLNFTKQNQESSTGGALKSSATSAKSAPIAKSVISGSGSGSGSGSVSSESSGPSANSNSSSNFVPRYNTSTLHLEPVFNTTARELYRTLLETDRIAAWTRSVPEFPTFPPYVGNTFKLFGGSVTGKFTELKNDERIGQDWRLEDWKTGHYAHLDIQLVQGTSDTKMVVQWSGIPVGEEERVRNNFESYYVRSIKLTFGFGAVL